MQTGSNRRKKIADLTSKGKQQGAKLFSGGAAPALGASNCWWRGVGGQVGLGTFSTLSALPQSMYYI